MASTPSFAAHQPTRRRRCWSIVAAGVCSLLGTWPSAILHAHPIANRPNEFPALTQHVQQALGAEKRRFHDATTCTEWFYKGQPGKPAAPSSEPISWRRPARASGTSPRPHSLPEDCPQLYPNGLEEARQAFSHAQAALSLGLTFYQLALVADRDDDGAYNSAELDDLLAAMALPSVAAQLDAADALKTRFDIWLNDRNLEQIMTGMGRLYDSGYRLSQADRAELDRVTR